MSKRNPSPGKRHMPIPEMNAAALARFMRLVKDNGPERCWEWLGIFNAQGYGVFSLNDRKFRANRIILKLKNGIDPGPLVGAHSCDNKSCVSPHHLSATTQKENCATAPRKRGEHHWNAKLSDEAVAIAHVLKAIGFRQREIAEIVRGTQSNISIILQGRSRRAVSSNCNPNSEQLDSR